MGKGDTGEKPACATLPESGFQCRHRWPGGYSRAGRQCDNALLHDRRGPGGEECLPREARARFFQVPALALVHNQETGSLPVGAREVRRDGVGLYGRPSSFLLLMQEVTSDTTDTSDTSDTNDTNSFGNTSGTPAA